MREAPSEEKRCPYKGMSCWEDSSYCNNPSKCSLWRLYSFAGGGFKGLNLGLPEDLNDKTEHVIVFRNG